jgi:hypothetical protein
MPLSDTGILFLFYMYGELRAYQLAQAAVQTFVIGIGIYRVVALAVELGRLVDYLPGTKLNTPATSFASFR